MRFSSLPGLLLLACLPHGYSQACTCGFPVPTLEEQRLAHSRAFHGVVVEKAENLEKSVRKMTFRVLHDFSRSGRSLDTVAIWSQLFESSCGVGYSLGKEVIIFADSARPDRHFIQGMPKDGLYTHLCSGNITTQLDVALRQLQESVPVRDGIGEPAAKPGKVGKTRSHGPVILYREDIKANGARATGRPR